jgi:hypothetical protein
MHYDATVRDLLNSLENTFFKIEEDSSEAFTKKTGFEDFRSSIANDWQHEMKAPTKNKD